ncbi:MAG: DNA alkylation repair protein [Bacteroidota bacterium]|nr:DNA alkylation repair protein [Bacteroidota bacterium]
MDSNILYHSLYNDLKLRQDGTNAIQMQKYMRNLFPFFGIKATQRREISYTYLRELKKEKTINWDFVFTCWAASERELQYIALDYLKENKKKLTDLDIPNLEQLIRNKSWWDSIDYLDRIIGNIALRHPHLNQMLLEWSLHPNFWYRRIAIDHQLDRKENTNTELLQEIILNNLNQKEFFINKAIGWSLRAYSKTNPKWVADFIEKHQDSLSRLSISEGSKYIKHLSEN